MAAVTVCSDFAAQEKVCHCFHSFPIYLPWSYGARCHISFWMFSCKPAFSLSSFTLIKRLFRSFSLFAIRVVSSAYLRLLIFLPANLIPAYASSSPVFLMMYSAYRCFFSSSAFPQDHFLSHLSLLSPHPASCASDMLSNIAVTSRHLELMPFNPFYILCQRPP